MTLRPMCCVALLALTVGVADVHGREAARAVTAARGFATPPSGEAPVRTPVSLRAAAPMLDDTAARPPRGGVPVVNPTPDPPAAPSRTLVLLSAFGAMALLIGRHLRRER
jgi:hypothetical protein